MTWGIHPISKGLKSSWALTVRAEARRWQEAQAALESKGKLITRDVNPEGIAQVHFVLLLLNNDRPKRFA